jgi:hypothetical protein
MTESDWLKKPWAYAMFQHALTSGRASDRKVRLFAVACCRRIWTLLPADPSRAAVTEAEHFGDGLVTEAHLASVCNSAHAVAHVILPPLPRLSREQLWDADRAAAFHAARAAAWAAYQEAGDAWSVSTEATRAVRAAREWDNDVVGPERAEQADLLRDLFGNPFRPPPPLDSSWLTWNGGTVVRLANAVYEHRVLPSGQFDGDRLAVLADALEEAGCTDQEILGHLRGPGPHVRGCWCVDLLLGRE